MSDFDYISGDEQQNTNGPDGVNSKGGIHGVGISDSKYSHTTRQLMEVINKLYSTGVQLDIELPQISVIGSQSVGKSSLIEAISGVTLPRASGTCTRCPTECRLIQSAGPWRCNVTLRFITDESGTPIQPIRNISFGETITDKADVEERLRRAQRAILNPSVDSKRYLAMDSLLSDEDALGFSSNCVSLEIEGPDVTDLSFCDLPGIIASVGEKGKTEDIDIVRNMVLSHIQRETCLILLAVSCETDFENQGALRLAKEVDPHGKRTIGVLTKVDRIEPGNEAKWLSILNGREEKLFHGWFAVKQPSPSELHAITREEARAAEQNWFNQPTWSRVRSRLGTPKLTEHLSKKLSDLIKDRLPTLQKQLQTSFDSTEKELLGLPPPVPKDPVREVNRLIRGFRDSVTRVIEGIPNKDGVLQRIRQHHDIFRKSIRRTAPDFRPYECEISEDSSDSVLDIPFLTVEEGDVEEGEISENVASTPIYLDDVLSMAKQARTRELPGHYPFVVRQELITDFMREWRKPSLELYQCTESILTAHVTQLLDQHFDNEAYAVLRQAVQTIITNQLKLCRESCTSKIQWFLDIERRAFTLNTHYLSQYKTDFLSFYKSVRAKRGAHASLITNLERPDGASVNDFENVLNTVMASLANLGFEGVKSEHLAKLLPVELKDDALEIMAEVRAYYQVVYKRFVDYIPLMIDWELLGGLERTIEAALYDGLRLSDIKAQERCANLLAQPTDMVAERQMLEARKARLEAAQHQLSSLWIG